MKERKESKKRQAKFSEYEIEVLVTQVEHRKRVFFGCLSSRISNKKNQAEWQLGAEAVNKVGSTQRTTAEVHGGQTMEAWTELLNISERNETFQLPLSCLALSHSSVQ